MVKRCPDCDHNMEYGNSTHSAFCKYHPYNMYCKYCLDKISQWDDFMETPDGKVKFHKTCISEREAIKVSSKKA